MNEQIREREKKGERKRKRELERGRNIYRKEAYSPNMLFTMILTSELFIYYKLKLSSEKILEISDI